MPDLVPLRVLPSGYFSFKWNKQNKIKHLLPWDKRINTFLHKPHFSFFYRIRFLSVLHNSVSKWKLRINQPYKTGGGCCVFVARDRANKHVRTVRTSVKQESIKLFNSFKWDKWLKTDHNWWPWDELIQARISWCSEIVFDMLSLFLCTTADKFT